MDSNELNRKVDVLWKAHIAAIVVLISVGVYFITKK
jgi:hypothetical protein